ncbi:MAG TPA: ATP-binding protein [Opitutaceae bacterium]|nr:ATP-binding protein [Opitutaceae bacterium]
MPPEGDSVWRIFLGACVERGRHVADLPFPPSGELKPATGLAWENKFVLVLVGRAPTEDVLAELQLLLPLVAATVRPEPSSGEPSLPHRESAARKAADAALKLVGDELTRANLELTRAREQAAAASATKDDFLAALSHELRTPLNPVLLIASEAAENPNLPDAVRGDFATIAKNAVIEARLIDDLLDLTRITRGKMSLDNRSADLRQVLEDALATMSADFEAKKIECTTAFDPRPHPVFGDSARLQQVFWNVLRNAVNFTPSHGRIRIETQVNEPGRQIVASVTDSGVGMTPAELERVFEPAAHAEQSPSGAHRAGGLGLGMAISRMLVQLHAGTIEAASAGREKGAAFIVKLPLAVSYSSGLPSVATASRGSASPLPAGKVPRRVLVVEDHESTSFALAGVLKRRGFEVVLADSMAAALNAAETGKFELVVSDIGLPDGDGYSLMTVLKRRHQLQGIAMSGYGTQDDIARSEAAGFVAHITKPVSVRALEAALELIRPAKP